MDQKVINLQKQVDSLQLLYFQLDSRVYALANELASEEDIDESYTDEEIPPLKKQKAETPIFQRKF